MTLKLDKINSNYLEILTKSGVFLFFRMGGLVLGYLFTLLVTKHYGAEVYGLVTLGLTVFMMLSILGKLGLDINFTRYVGSRLYPAKSLKGLFFRLNLLVFGFSVVLSSLIIYFSDWISIVLFNKPEFSEYLKWSAMAVPFWSLILIHSGLFRGLRRNTLFSVFNTFGRLLLTVLIVVFPFGIISNGTLPLIAHFIAIFVLCLASFWVSIRLFEKESSSDASINVFDFLKESSPILMSSFAFILLSWVDRIIVGLNLTAEDVAIYDVSAKLAVLVSFNLEAINSILAPKVSEFYAMGNRKELKKILGFSVLTSSLISLTTFVLLLVFAIPLLKLFGNEYTAGIQVLAILATGQLVNCLCGSVGVILQMTGNQGKYWFILIVGLFVNLTASLLLVKSMGVIGVAVATMCSMILWNLLGAYYVKTELNLISVFNPFKYIWNKKK